MRHLDVGSSAGSAREAGLGPGGGQGAPGRGSEGQSAHTADTGDRAAPGAQVELRGPGRHGPGRIAAILDRQSVSACNFSRAISPGAFTSRGARVFLEGPPPGARGGRPSVHAKRSLMSTPRGRRSGVAFLV